MGNLTSLMFENPDRTNVDMHEQLQTAETEQQLKLIKSKPDSLKHQRI